MRFMISFETIQIDGNNYEKRYEMNSQTGVLPFNFIVSVVILLLNEVHLLQNFMWISMLNDSFMDIVKRVSADFVDKAL